MGVRTPALAGHPEPILVISAGETGKSCREFPGARPACRGIPETPADNAGCSGRANRSVYTVDSHGCSVRANRSVYIVDASGCSFTETTELCAWKEGVRFGREPKCACGKTVIPRTLMCYVMLG